MRAHIRFGFGRTLATVAAVLAVIATACASDVETAEVPPGTEIDVALGLERDQKGLGAAALDANTPGAGTYGTYLTIDEINSMYGASDVTKKKLQSVLGERDIDVEVHATGGFAQARMSIADVTDLFGVKFSRQTASDGSTSLSASDASIPGDLDGVVTEVVGLGQTIPVAPTPTPSATPSPTGDSCGGTDPTAAFAAIHGPVGISALAERGFKGGGMQVAIDSIDAFDSVAFGLWRDCLGLDIAEPIVHAVHDDDRGLSQEAEVDLDVATLTGALPELERLDIFVFDQFDWIGSPVAAALDVSNTGGSLPDAIVTSVVFCESDLTTPAIDLAEWVVGSAAAAGVPVVASAGDHGSSGCYPPDKKEVVQYPASSVFATGVGGTQGASPPAIWFDAQDEFAGGGGPSADVSRPEYQGLESVAGASSGKRLTPDVAAPADPSAAPAIPVCDRSAGTCEWKLLGGTSMSAPLVAAALVQTEQLLSEAGRVGPGFINPVLYGVDQSTRAGFTTDITTGTNDLFDVGCCSAATGFDMASGWGSINIADLAEYLSTTAPAAPS